MPSCAEPKTKLKKKVKHQIHPLLPFGKLSLIKVFPLNYPDQQKPCTIISCSLR